MARLYLGERTASPGAYAGWTINPGGVIAWVELSIVTSVTAEPFYWGVPTVAIASTIGPSSVEVQFGLPAMWRRHQTYRLPAQVFGDRLLFWRRLGSGAPVVMRASVERT